jgi:hypothetical protein
VVEAAPAERGQRVAAPSGTRPGRTAMGAGLRIGRRDGVARMIRWDGVSAGSSGRGGWGSIAIVFFSDRWEQVRRFHSVTVTEDKWWGLTVSYYIT